MTTILLLSVLGAVIAAMVGTVWYNPSLTPMGKWHMKALGFDKLSKSEQAKLIEEAKPHMWKSYLGQMLLSFVTSFFIVYVTSQVHNDAYKYVGFIWLAFTVPNIGSAMIWSNTDRKLAWKRFASDSLSALVSMFLLIFITSLFY